MAILASSSSFLLFVNYSIYLQDVSLAPVSALLSIAWISNIVDWPYSVRNVYARCGHAETLVSR